MIPAAFNAIKIFSVVHARDRELLGERITEWIAAHPTLAPMGFDMSQSSDREHHCLTITLYLQHDGEWPVTPDVPPPRIYTFTPDKKRRR